MKHRIVQLTPGGDGIQTPPFPYLDPRPCCEPVPLIAATDLSIEYAGRPALRDVSLSVPRGCVTALVGPSGCGKTSFLSALNRLTDMTARCRVRGSLTCGDLDVLDPALDVVALRRRVGMIFQEPNPFPFSIRRNLSLPLREHGIRDRATVDGMIETALRDVGLWDEVHDRLDHPAAQLSGGQQQRLCLARALVLEPEVLLLDEPTSALDPIAAGRVEELIAALRGRYTMVLVTHNLAQARRLADHVAVFWHRDGCGRLIEAGTAAQVFESPHDPLVKAYVTGLSG